MQSGSLASVPAFSGTNFDPRNHKKINWDIYPINE